MLYVVKDSKLCLCKFYYFFIPIFEYLMICFLEFNILGDFYILRYEIVKKIILVNRKYVCAS